MVDKNKEAHDAYWWVMWHPKLQYERYTPPMIEIEPHMVNPKTNSVDDDPQKNTKLEYWIECGPYVKDHGSVVPSHDWELDCGGDTIEEAFLALKRLVLQKYGNYNV